MNRWICTLALLTSPLMAQEQSPKSPTQIDELIKKVTPELERAILEKSTRDRVLTAFREALWLASTNTGSLFRVPAAETTSFFVRPGQTGEMISGTWSAGDGSNVQYTLSSQGKGRYSLRALRYAKDGSQTSYKDEGTLLGLRKKYAFLRKFGMLRIVPRAIDPKSIVTVETQPRIVGTSLIRTLAFVTKQEIKLIKTLGIIVRRPSKELEYHLKLPTETTWIVEKVLPNAKPGLRKLDLLTEADGVDLSEQKTLEDAKKVLVVTRRGKTMRIALDG